MRGYLVRRIVIAILVLYIIATLNFMIFQVIAPLDPTDMIINPKFSEEAKQLLLKQYGLLEPLHIRYFKYIVNMFTWNFGFSFETMAPVTKEMSWRLVNTILLLGTALVGTIMVGIPIGILAASRRGTKIDVTVLAAGLFTDGVPTFFIQMMSLLLFSYYVMLWFGAPIFPSRGKVSVPPPEEPLAYMADVAWHLAQPALTLIVAAFGGWALYVRNLVIDALTQDYVLTARAKGLSERTVLYRHAFRSVLPPIVTIIAMNVPYLITGAVITELIFTWPGIGQWYIAALNSANFPVVQALLFIFAFLMLVANLVADLLYGVLDPRIRFGYRR